MNAGWSDPFIFRTPGRTFVTFKSSGGAVCEALDPALTKWKFAGRMAGVSGECPNFVPLGGRWVLLRSTYPPSYRVGRFDPEAMKFHMDGPRGTLDHAYGPKRPRNFSIKRGKPEVSLVEIYQRGPNQVREAVKARSLMRILEDHGWVFPLDQPVEFDGADRVEGWGIIL